jgi:hypothetical protein
VSVQQATPPIFSTLPPPNLIAMVTENQEKAGAPPAEIDAMCVWLNPKRQWGALMGKPWWTIQLWRDVAAFTILWGATGSHGGSAVARLAHALAVYDPRDV